MTLEANKIVDFIMEGTASSLSPLPTYESDLDFLDDLPATGGGPAAAALQPLRRCPPGDRRRQVGEALAHSAFALPEQASLWRTLTGDPRLAAIDGEATLLLCRLALAEPAAATLSGAALQASVLPRALAASDQYIMQTAAATVVELRLLGLQAEFAAALGRHLAAISRDDRAKMLDFLEQHGDGRCVRPLEALLAQHGTLLDDGQAWRARHVVQIIRRDRRK